jgi:hypothetical protein
VLGGSPRIVAAAEMGRIIEHNWINFSQSVPVP